MIAVILAGPGDLLLRAKARVIHAVYLDQVGAKRQLASDDCGVTAMEMLLVHLTGRDERLDSLRDVTINRRRGLSFDEMRAVAAQRGLEANGWQLSLTELRARSFPAIVQFPGHFLVLDSIGTADGVILRDPAIGRIRMSIPDFERAWTGRALFVHVALPIPSGPP